MSTPGRSGHMVTISLEEYLLLMTHDGSAATLGATSAAVEAAVHNMGERTTPDHVRWCLDRSVARLPMWATAWTVVRRRHGLGSVEIGTFETRSGAERAAAADRAALPIRQGPNGPIDAVAILPLVPEEP